MRCFLVFLLVTIINGFSQEIQFVDAPNGLIVRDEPSKKGNRIGKLDFGSRIEVLKRTGKEISVKDDGVTVNGEWFEIHKINESVKGYVFSGFLSPNNGSSYGYYLTKIDENSVGSYFNVVNNQTEHKPGYVFLKNIKNEELLKFKITEFETYEGTDLYVTELEGLSNVNQLIKVDINYSACCTSTDEHYYLKTEGASFIKLPRIDNTHCDGPEPYFDYVFPKDKYGQEGKILYAKINPEVDGEKETIQVLKTYSWNGKKLKELN